MNKHFHVTFRGADGTKDVISVYASGLKEARFVAIESHPWLKLHPNHLLHVLEIA